MPYPNDFYYKLKSSDSLYSFTPQGQLHVGKLIRSQPYWKKPNLASEEKKKSLILADWTASGWSDLRRREVTHVIRKLLEDGFELSIWQDGQVKPLNKNNLSILDEESVCKDMNPEAHEKIITSTMQQCKLPRVEVQILDDYWIQAIIDQKFDKPRQLKISDVLNSKHKQEKIFPALAKCTPKLEQVLVDEFSEKSCTFLQSLSLSDIVSGYRSLTLSGSMARLLIMNTQLAVKGLTIELSQLTEIETFSFYDYLDAKVLKHLLLKAHKIKYLNLEVCALQDNLDEELDLKLLETLNLRSSSITAQNLQYILANAIGLKELNLQECKMPVGNLTDSLNLKSLELLNLEKSVLSVESFRQLLVKSKNLKSLNLAGWIITPDMITEDLNLKELEFLDLSGVQISAKSLQHLLSKAKNLKTIKLEKCNISGDLAEALNLESLENLDLSSTTISTQTLKHLLAKTVKLKSLECQALNGINKDLKLNSLETLSLYKGLSEEDLMHLLANIESLKCLCLPVKELTVAGDLTQDLKLNSLKELTLMAGEISAQNLNHLLANAENIKSLSLSHLKEISGDHIKKVNLKSLENFTIAYTTLSAKSLQNLLVRTENLKSLDFYICIITDNIIDDLDLNSLEFLDLDGTTITAQSLEFILAKAENLKSLDLSTCEIVGDIASNVNLNSLESLNLPRESISAKSLQSILAKAENLKSLDLSTCEIVGDIASNLNLNSLENLKLPGASISAKSLQHLLVKAENLTSLSLIEGSVKGDMDDDLNLKSLESLNLFAAITAQSLQSILAKAENLKSLNLGQCSVAGDITVNLNLKSLEKLELPLVCSIKNLQHLLANAENLKSLDLENSLGLKNCGIKGDSDDDFNLKSLETLALDGTAISTLQLQHLLAKTENLKSLTLGEIKIDVEMRKTILNLKKLEKLKLKGSPKGQSITAKSLEALLAKAPHLKELDIHNHFISNDMTEKLPLERLEILNLTGHRSNITAGSLQRLLAHTEKLITLNLERCTIVGDITGKLNFNSLKTLYIEYTNINTTNLIALLLAAPNLKVLKVDGCKNINFNDHYLQKILNEKGIKIPTNHSFFQSTPETQTYNYSDSEKKIPSTGDLFSDLLSTGNLPLNNPAPQQINDPDIAGEKAATDTSPLKNAVQDSLAPQQRRNNSSMQVDANTENSKKEFKLNQFFCGRNRNPHPSEYRLSIHHRLTLNQKPVSIDEAFTLDNQSEDRELDLKLQKTFIPRNNNDVFEKFESPKTAKDDGLFYGKINLILDDKWQALPSISSKENILEYHLDDANVFCEIKYSERDNLYYIRSGDEDRHEVKMDFLLKTLEQEETHLPEKLHNLIKWYTQFGEGAHSFKGPGIGQKYLDAIHDEEKGACRHRAVALMDAIQNHKKDLELPDTTLCRYISNDCHAFVEVQLKPGAPWIAYNLGGYAADLTIDKGNLPNQLTEKPLNTVPLFEVIEILKANEESENPIPVKSLQIQQAPDFSSRFETWQKHKPRFHSPDAYCQRLVSGQRKKQLIELSSTATVQAMSLALEIYCQHINRPVFYIHSPDDLVCSAPYVEKQGERGELKSGKDGQGGPLHDFLITNQNKANPPILIVNYDRFDADDIVRLNSLLDKEPKADGTPLPDCAVVIGLINPEKPGCYQGEDFYSRFGVDNIETCPFSANVLLPPIKAMEERKEFVEDVFTINLCHSEDWEERLLGRWLIKKDNLYFEEGLLVKALNSGFPIEIQNGLWSDESFCHFWDRARALGHIESYGERFDISKAIFIQSEGYDWGKLTPRVKFDLDLKNNATILNPSKFTEFFKRYECDNETHLLDTLKGFIEANANQILHVNLTRTLNEDQWAALLIECEKHQVTLHCHCAPSVSLPPRLGKLPELITPVKTNETMVIESDDVDVTVEQLTETTSWKVIDVSELSSNDLLTNLRGEVIKKRDKETQQEKPAFKFTQANCALIQALSKGEKVILKGQFSTELTDALAPLLLERQAGIGDGQLILVTNDATNLNYVALKQHEVRAKDKRRILEKSFSSDAIKTIEADLESEPLCRLKAKLIQPDPWVGLKGLTGGIQPKAFDADTSKTISEDFIKLRQTAVNALLEKSPFVFLTGLTGVGKSTFVEKHLVSGDEKLHHGIAKIHDWILDKAPGRKILFLDEANITSRQWSEFEGLFQTPPGLLINGEFHPLTENHKVVFAGNPLNYGGERKMASLFERHGKAVVFNPMPPEFIYERVLKPIFVNTTLDTLIISTEILKIYHFLCQLSEDKVLISPRELQMMALLVLAHADKNPNDDIIQVTQHYAYLLAKNLVPENHRHSFQKQFQDPMPHSPVEKQPANFILTPSREPLYNQLNDLIALREHRRINSVEYGRVVMAKKEPTDVNANELVALQEDGQLTFYWKENEKLVSRTFSETLVESIIERLPSKGETCFDLTLIQEIISQYQCSSDSKLNEGQLYGGLGGIVIEGDPGIGKSELVIANLRAHEYKEVYLSTKNVPEKAFYRMPISMQPDEKRVLLLKAFHEGAIVIIDEINSAPMMEDLLNDLLMGKGPNGERPNQPGFLVIGTQNPVTMAGRFKPSNALERRLTTDYLPPYPNQELETILVQSRIEITVAKEMISAYQTSLKKATREHLTPAPTVRDLLQVADNIVKGFEQVIAEKIKDENQSQPKLPESLEIEFPCKEIIPSEVVNKLEVDATSPVLNDEQDKRSSNQSPIVHETDIVPVIHLPDNLAKSSSRIQPKQIEKRATIEKNAKDAAHLTKANRGNVSLNYRNYITKGEGRSHYYHEVTCEENFKNDDLLKSQYRGLKGDHLKSKILSNFKKRIDMVTDRQEFLALEKELLREDNPETNVLRQAQGAIFSFFSCFGLTTTSMDALEDMLAQRKNDFPNSKTNS